MELVCFYYLLLTLYNGIELLKYILHKNIFLPQVPKKAELKLIDYQVFTFSFPLLPFYVPLITILLLVFYISFYTKSKKKRTKTVKKK